MVCMLSAERDCRKLKTGAVAFSPRLKRVGAGIEFLKLAMKKKRGEVSSTRKMDGVRRKSNLQALRWQMKSLCQLGELLQKQEKMHRSLKPHSFAHRRTFLENQARQQEESGHELCEVALKKLLSIEEQRRQAKACLLYTSPSPRDLSTSRMPSSA